MTNNASNADDLSEFRSAFFEECTEMLASVDAHLSGTEGAPPDIAALNDIFRAVHTIKGSAGFFDLPAIVQFAHIFETLLSEARDGNIAQNEQLAALLVDGADALASIVDRSRGGSLPPDLGRDVADRIQRHLSQTNSAHTTLDKAADPSSPEGQQAAGDQQCAKTGGPEHDGGKTRPPAATIRVELARVDRLVNMVGELVITQAMLSQQLADDVGGSRQQLRHGHEELANYTRELQECVMAIRMQPVKSVFSRMPRLVRDISSKLGKKVALIMSGEQTEVDKTVVEELADPLLHMIRNAIDHGIESSERRIAQGKAEEGRIELSAKQRGGNILITLCDDGAGIDRQRVLGKAIERGIVHPDATPSGEEIDQLIFAPGFSTAETVTDVSGRGVGMDVVQSKITNLGGRIHIQSTFGQGTKFTLVLPLTLAVLDGMMVSVASETYILPLTNIVESIRPQKSAVRTLANGSTVVSIRGELIRLVNLGDVFGLTGHIMDASKGLVVVAELDNGTKLGVIVDELLGQRQVVVKNLNDNFDPILGISGATILGNGRVALILDLEQLSKLSAHHRGSKRKSGSDSESPPNPTDDLHFSLSLEPQLGGRLTCQQ